MKTITELKKNYFYELTFTDEKINLECKRKFYYKKELENFINKWSITDYKIEIKPMLKNDDYYTE